MNPPITPNELREAIVRYFEEFSDEQRIELLLRFVAAQPTLAYSLNFPEEENFAEVVRIDVCHFAAVIYLLFKDRFEMPEITEDNIADIYKRIDGMLNYINGDAEAELEVERLYPEPALLRHVKEFILEHHEYLSPVQCFDLFFAMAGLVDAFAQAKKRHAASS